MAAIIFPPNPAGQTPVNTFSPTSTPLANTSNSFTYVWNGTAWTSAPGAPMSAASLAEAAAGVIDTKFSSPQTAVPKDAAGMTGAAILPNGVSGVRPASPATGMFRLNTTASVPYTTATASGLPEFYDGAKWVPCPPMPTPLPSASSSKFLSFNSVSNGFQWQGATDYISVGASPSGAIGDVQQGFPANPNPGSVIAQTPSVSGVSFGLFCCHGYQYMGAGGSLFQDGISVYDATIGAYIHTDYVETNGDNTGGMNIIPFSVQTTLNLDPTHTYFAVMWGAKGSATGIATGAGGTVRFIAFN